MHLFTPDRDELFRRVLGSSDFSKAKTGLQIAGTMFNQLFPVIETITKDNEILLIDQAKQMKQFGDLDTKYKELVLAHEKLQKNHDTLRSDLQKEGNEAVE